MSDSAEGIAEIIAKRDSEKGEHIQRALREKIRNVDQGGWQNAIRTGHDPYNLAITLSNEEDFLFGKSSHLYKALAGEAPAIALKGGDQTSRWVALAGLLSEKTRRAAFKVLGEEILAGRAGKNLLVLLKVGGQQLVQHGDFAKSADRALGSVFLPLVENAKGRDWLKDHAKDLRMWIGRVGNAQRREVKQCLEKMAKSSNANRRYWAELMLGEFHLN